MKTPMDVLAERAGQHLADIGIADINTAAFLILRDSFLRDILMHHGIPIHLARLDREIQVRHLLDLPENAFRNLPERIVNYYRQKARDLAEI